MPPTLPAGEDTPGEKHEFEPSESTISEPPWNPMFDVEEEEELDTSDGMYGYHMLSPYADALAADFPDDMCSDSEEELANIDVVEEDDEKTTPKPVAMDPEHIETIKSIMKNITLPSTNLPSWTASVPEEEWQEVLVEKIGGLSVVERQQTAGIKDETGASSSIFARRDSVPHDKPHLQEEADDRSNK